MADEDILLSGIKDKIKDKRIRQTLDSGIPERAVFGSGGVSGFLGTTDLPPEAYGTDYKNLPDPFRKAIEEVADMDLKDLRKIEGQTKLERALLKNKVPLKEVKPFAKSVREAAEVWLDKDSREFMKQVAKTDAPSKVGHIGDLLKANKQGTPKIKTLLKWLGKGIRGLTSAQKLGAAAVVGGLLTKAIDMGVDMSSDEEPMIPPKPAERKREPVMKEPSSLDDLRERLKQMDFGE